MAQKLFARVRQQPILEVVLHELHLRSDGTVRAAAIRREWPRKFEKGPVTMQGRLCGTFVAILMIAFPVSADTPQTLERLPDSILSLAFALRSDPGLATDADKNRGGGMRAVFRDIAAMLPDGADDVLLDFSLADRLCKIQSGDRGHFCGHAAEKLPDPTGGGVFVATPVTENGNRVVLIVSSVSPERTRILSIGQEAPARLVYDSLASENACETPDVIYPLRSVYLVAVRDPGVLVLRESGNIPAREGQRTVALEILGPECAMSVEYEIAPAPD